MSRQVQDAYIVAATRTPIGKAPKGMFRHHRPDEALQVHQQDAQQRETAQHVHRFDALGHRDR